MMKIIHKKYSIKGKRFIEWGRSNKTYAIGIGKHVWFIDMGQK